MDLWEITLQLPGFVSDNELLESRMENNGKNLYKRAKIQVVNLFYD